MTRSLVGHYIQSGGVRHFQNISNKYPGWPEHSMRVFYEPDIACPVLMKDVCLRYSPLLTAVSLEAGTERS